MGDESTAAPSRAARATTRTASATSSRPAVGSSRSRAGIRGAAPTPIRRRCPLRPAPLAEDLAGVVAQPDVSEPRGDGGIDAPGARRILSATLPERGRFLRTGDAGRQRSPSSSRTSIAVPSASSTAIRPALGIPEPRTAARRTLAGCSQTRERHDLAGTHVQPTGRAAACVSG